MNNEFVSLKNGMIINVAACAYIHPVGGPHISKQLRGVQIVFPSMFMEEELGTQILLTVELTGDDAEDFLDALKKRGIDVTYLSEARKDLGRGVHAAIARATGPLSNKGPGFPGPKSK